MTKFRKKYIKLLFLFASLLWAILWGVLFVPLYLKYVNANPNFAGNFTIPISWIIKWSGYWISMLIMGFILTGNYGLRFSLAALFFTSIFVMISPPLCINLNGTLFTSANNYSCYLGDDALMSWIFHFIIPYGNNLLYYIVYVGGVILFATLFIMSASKKEMWKSIVEKFNGNY